MSYTIGPEGPRDVTCAIVAEKGAKEEVTHGRLMVGATGSLIRYHANKAGFDAGTGFADWVNAKGRTARNVWLTNAVHTFDDPYSNPTCQALIREQPRLYRELASLHNLRCIIAVGAHAFASLTNFGYCYIGTDKNRRPGFYLDGEPETGITNRRGSKYLTPWGCKVVATIHPAFYVRGEQRYKSVCQFDFNRAFKEAQYADIRSPRRDFYIRPESMSELQDWASTLISRPLSHFLSLDIETFQGRRGTWYISCIGFSDHPSRAFCIPIMYRDRRPYWSDPHVEGQVWRIIQHLLALPDRYYVTQNGHAFDCWQLHKHHISTPFMANGFDTYSGHMLLAPDLPHDLGFLTSIYTEENYYKDESGRTESVPVSDEQFWQYNCKDAAFTLEIAAGFSCELQEGLIADLAESGMLDKGHYIRSPLPKRTRILGVGGHPFEAGQIH